MPSSAARTWLLQTNDRPAVHIAFAVCYPFPRRRTLREHYPTPWEVVRMPGGYAVRAKNGFTLVRVYAPSDEELQIANSWNKLSWSVRTR